MSEINTDTMKPANGASTTPGADAAKPKRRRKVKAKKPPMPTPEQFQVLGQIAFSARGMQMTLEEYVDYCRSVVETYDALMGSGIVD